MIKAAVFLGNPGLQYEKTRHNAGRMLLPYLSLFSRLEWTSKFKGEYAACSINSRKFLLLKPEIFINLSGQSAAAFMHYFKLTPEELIVIHDDLETAFGTISFKQGGGLAGHNGLRSISESLGTNDFYRFKIGIGRPPRGSVSSFVLGRFSSDEEIVLGIFLQKAASILENILDNNSLKEEKIIIIT